MPNAQVAALLWAAFAVLLGARGAAVAVLLGARGAAVAVLLGARGAAVAVLLGRPLQLARCDCQQVPDANHFCLASLFLSLIGDLGPMPWQCPSALRQLFSF